MSQRFAETLNSPWAITPNMFQEIRAIYETHLRGDKINIEEVEARLGHPLDNLQKSYEVINGTAVLTMHGVIARRMNMFSRISGGVSTELLGRDFKAALADKAVERIVLDIDSPGGGVDGTAELAETIYAARGEKPIIAVASGMMASAAYWLGSAADKVFITGPTTMVGSIGVVATHVDVSGAEKKAGIKTTEIVAGRYKRISSRYAPLSDEGQENIQEQVDYIYGVFVDAVAMHRGVGVESVLTGMADGKTFIGQQAINAGLVDGVATLDGAVAKNHLDQKGAMNMDIEANLPDEERWEQEWRRNPALRAEFMDNKASYMAYQRANANGQCRVYSDKTVTGGR